MAADMNKQPDEAQPSAPEQPQYRKVSEEELKRIRTDHEKWLVTKGEKGTQADLSNANLRGANLQGANLFGANLQGANLIGANLQGAHLRDANLQGANLRIANFKEADLIGANLQEADLRDAKLSDVRPFGAGREAAGDRLRPLPRAGHRQ